MGDDNNLSGQSGDSYTETSVEGFGSRLMNSIKSVGIGFLLFVAAFPVLWKNEGCAVASYKGLSEGLSKVVSVDSARLDASNNGKLIHFMGEAVTGETLNDGDFGISQKAIKIIRAADMYQWEEKVTEKKEKKIGGKEETVKTYTYDKAWKSSVIDSSTFKIKAGHVNPAVMEYSAKTVVAKDVKVGAIPLNDELIGMISKSEPLPFNAELMKTLPASLKSEAKQSDDGLYIGKDPAAPQIGDLKIKFSIVKPQQVSVIAQQLNSMLTSYVPEQGEKILMLSAGAVTPDAMFKQAASEVGMRTWILRLVGFLMMAIGLSMVFSPLTTLADVLPFLGDLLRLGVGIFAAIAAFALSLVTIAIAWLFFRPVIGILLILAGVGAFFGVRYFAKQKNAKAGVAAAK